MNKLHVILGYLQIGETQQAMEFIMNSSLVSSQSIREAAAQIRVSKLCALIVGKMMRAAELGIRLTVQPDSICMENDLLLPVQEYVTIVGNLLENAIEELSQKKDPPREIHLGLYCRPAMWCCARIPAAALTRPFGTPSLSRVFPARAKTGASACMPFTSW